MGRVGGLLLKDEMGITDYFKFMNIESNKKRGLTSFFLY